MKSLDVRDEEPVEAQEHQSLDLAGCGRAAQVADKEGKG